MKRTRRQFLVGTGVAATGVLAGCTQRGNGSGDSGASGGGSSGDNSGSGAGGSSGSGSGDETAGSGGSDDVTTTGNPDSLANHPAAAGLAEQPTLGPPPAEATGVIVAFEDPSCPRCRNFEQNTVPKIRSELVETGQASFVFRGYPIVYDWGEPATKALEATFARSESAHWALVEHYFDEQDAFRSAGPDQVYPRTEAFLAANTDLDAAAVVADARSGAADAAVQVDLDAGDGAALWATPTVVLFRDGQYQTLASGSISFSVVRSALGL